jgi:riboflavin kinase / FMN adenylyltransferase
LHALLSVHHEVDSYPAPPDGVVLSIGNFDGVHRGHQAILRAARRRADTLGIPLVVLTFEPHPKAVFAPEQTPPRLTTIEERLALLARYGVDDAVVVRSRPEFFSRSAADFIGWMVARLRPRVVVEGPTFTFGHGREGNAESLLAFGRRHGFDVEIAGAVQLTDLPGEPTVSSSEIRRRLISGAVDEAALMLERSHRISGRVGSGVGRGGPLVVATANLIEVPQLVPAEGVYAAVAQRDDDALFLAAVNVGYQPTFEESAYRIEAHLLDFEGELRGAELGLHFLRFIRPQQRFENVDALIAQIREDVGIVRDQFEALNQLRAAGLLPLPPVAQS